MKNAGEGLSFALTDDQKEFLQLAETFTANEIIPAAPELDRTGAYPWEIIKKAHETGLMNMHIPQTNRDNHRGG